MNVLYSAPSFAAALLPSSARNLDQPAYFFVWGPIQISAANLIVIGIGLVLFVLAIVIPFPRGRRRP